MRRFGPTALAALLAVLLAGCGSSGDSTTTASKSADKQAKGAECQKVKAPAPKGDVKVPKPKLKLDPSVSWSAVVKTSCGTFTIALDVKRAPKTASSFAALAKRGFYDDLTFHRIVSGFVIQGGDPKGDGTGGPGYSVVEAPPEDLAYTRGIVAMAKTELEDPGTSGSQFFVVTGEDIQLPAQYALVGKVSDGQDVVDRIGVLPADAQDRPLSPVVIESVTIQKS